jgi:predicted transcriptional regulator of viral defense system
VITIPLTLTDEQIGAIACRVAAELRERPPLVKEFFTVKEAAAILQVSTVTIRRMLRAGLLDRIPHLDAIRIPAKSLMQHQGA